MKEIIKGFTNLKFEEVNGKYLAPVIKDVIIEKHSCYYPETGEKRDIILEFHARDDEWAGDTAKRFMEEYVVKYAKTMNQDDHKYDTSMAIPDTILGFTYTLAKDAKTGELLGFYAKRCWYKQSYRGKEAIALDGHSMCALPGIVDKELFEKIKENVSVTTERGNDNNKFTNVYVIKNEVDRELINTTEMSMGGRGLKEEGTNAGLGTLLALCDWNNAARVYDHPMLYSLDVANEASGYVLTHKFDKIAFEGKNWKELSWRTNNKGQRCQIRIERLFHPENWE